MTVVDRSAAVAFRLARLTRKLLMRLARQSAASELWLQEAGFDVDHA